MTIAAGTPLFREAEDLLADGVAPEKIGPLLLRSTRRQHLATSQPTQASVGPAAQAYLHLAADRPTHESRYKASHGDLERPLTHVDAADE
jgi:hypothetical protein